MAEAAYTVRRGPFEAAKTWRIEGDNLIEPGGRRADRVWPLGQVRLVRIAPGVNRYVPNEQVARLSFRKGAVGLGSHTFLGLANYGDQGREFTAFVRTLCAAVSEASPSARFQAGAAQGAGIFTGAAAILGAGIVLLLLAAAATGAWALGLELGSRLVFVLILMFAVQPWLSSAAPRRFDPRSIPADVLA